MSTPLPTRREAERCIQSIEKYWRERGHSVRLHVVRETVREEAKLYAIRSDMINGFPRGYSARRDVR